MVYLRLWWSISGNKNRERKCLYHLPICSTPILSAFMIPLEGNNGVSISVKLNQQTQKRDRDKIGTDSTAIKRIFSSFLFKACCSWGFVVVVVLVWFFVFRVPRGINNSSISRTLKIKQQYSGSSNLFSLGFVLGLKTKVQTSLQHITKSTRKRFNSLIFRL